MIIFHANYFIHKKYEDFLNFHDISQWNKYFQNLYQNQWNITNIIKGIHKKIKININIVIFQDGDDFDNFIYNKDEIYIIFRPWKEAKFIYNKYLEYNKKQNKILQKIDVFSKKQYKYKYNYEIKFLENLDIFLSSQFLNGIFTIIFTIFSHFKSIWFTLFILFLLYKWIIYIFCILWTIPLLTAWIIFSIFFVILFLYQLILALWFDINREFFKDLWLLKNKKASLEKKRLIKIFILFIWIIIFIFPTLFYISEFKSEIKKNIAKSQFWNTWICKNL